MYESFIDLDELIVQCRDKLSRKCIQEAVSCYRAGAFRSCIVATWNAVVFDFLHKLRELKLFGDKEAAKLLEEFERLRVSGQFRELWKFESDIPEIALTKFELISTIEKSDIERLFEDRSRCAHPSMASLEDPFEATAELARYHLRSAVTHLLARPPVQGRAAKERIFQDIKSEYFPVDPELAIKYFQKSPLARARFILIKDIIVGLTKSLLIEEHLEDERSRQFSALNAISNMYPKETREILNSQLSDIIMNRVADENWDKAIIYLGNITAWDSLSEPCRLKAETYIDKINIFEISQKHSKRLSQKVISILVKASHIVFLRESVTKKLQIPLEQLLSLRETCEDDIFKEKILIPVLRESSSQATLDELILMRSDALLKSDERIQTYTKQKIEASSLQELVSIQSEYQDNWFTKLIEADLKKKIFTASLDDLFVAKSAYKLRDEPNLMIVELFGNAITRKVKAMSFEDFSNERKYLNENQRRCLDEISDKLTDHILKDNISEIINMFTTSKSFLSAKYNSWLLVKIAGYLSPTQWEDILNAFFENHEIYGSTISISCCKEFESLFTKSLELSDSVQYYWSSFREKLNKLDNQHVKSLKQLIDLHTVGDEF